MFGYFIGHVGLHMSWNVEYKIISDNSDRNGTMVLTSTKIFNFFKQIETVSDTIFTPLILIHVGDTIYIIKLFL